MRKMTITIRDGYGKRENNNKDESSKKKNESDETKQIKRRILLQRNRTPPKRYGDYRGYLIEIEELNEEEIIYNEAEKCDQQ